MPVLNAFLEARVLFCLSCLLLFHHRRQLQASPCSTMKTAFVALLLLSAFALGVPARPLSGAPLAAAAPPKGSKGSKGLSASLN